MTPLAFDPASLFLLFLIAIGVVLFVIVIYAMTGFVAETRRGRGDKERHPTHTRVEGDTPESREE